MPLRALQGETNVLAYEKTAVEWEEIKQTYREKDLRMPCCSTIAIPKTSHLGNHFFSHHTKGNCASAGESLKHIYIKTLIAKAAIDVGWRAITEFRGTSPSGSQWVADVYCTKGDEARVIEVQLSGQTPEEFNRRQRMYVESGVKSLWLASRFNRNRLEPSLDLPVFELEMISDRSVPMIKEFEVSLPEFVNLALSGRLRWKKDQITLLYAEDECWSCKAAIRKIRGWKRSGAEENTDALLLDAKLLSDIRKVVGNDALRDLGLCVIKFSESESEDLAVPLHCNTCPHCGVLQNNWARMVKAGANPRFGEVTYTVPKESTGQWRILPNST